MFSSLLVANRGEIACRVIRTARSMGLRTIAVYSEADARALHVEMADEAYLIGPPPVAESYLRGEIVLEVAARAGAEAIHPGYGFLSENADFAEACALAGLIFVGPPASAIRAMGSKSGAKALMNEAGVPLVPGYHGNEQSSDLLAKEAARIGYPVMIKASAGGGGKGMRLVERPADFQAALEGAQREAKASFGDDQVLIERYLTRPRHIEIQVFADSHGACVHLFERDCSVQRRHQKVLEEAPAPGMTEDRRASMGKAAVEAARAIGYVGAGTVEFIAEDSSFFFMEMNTRLQVEHPVTEMITGTDLVEWQLRVAAGEPLPKAQEELAITGHAFEARVYAEDPTRGFLPATGRLIHYRSPASAPGVRVDTGVRSGDEISPFYDPMIAKLVTWGEDRGAALRTLRQALASYEIAGPATNLTFLQRLADHPAFAAGAVETGFIAQQSTDLLTEEVLAPRDLALACLAELLRDEARARTRATMSSDPHSPFHMTNGWRLNSDTLRRIEFWAGEERHTAWAHYRPEGYEIELADGTRLAAFGVLSQDGALSARLDDHRLTARVAWQGALLQLMQGGRTLSLRLGDPLDLVQDEEGVDGRLVSPLPGKVARLLVREGQAVEAGAPLIVIEAMKMEHSLVAPAPGRIDTIYFAEGDQVEEGVELLAFEAAEA